MTFSIWIYGLSVHFSISQWFEWPVTSVSDEWRKKKTCKQCLQVWKWWATTDSNRRPSRCKRDALTN